MSVKVMGLVWDLNLPSNEKFVLLAYADHADHNGGNIFPAVATIARKTGYTERNVQLVTRLLEEKELLIPDGNGPHGTNKWKMGGEIFSPVKFAPVKSDAVGGENQEAKGVNPSSPDPSLNHPEPSEREAALDFASMDVPTARRLPTLRTYFLATGFFPGSVLWQYVHERMTTSGVTEKQLKEAAVAWAARGFNEKNVQGVLDWAINGIPTNGKGAPEPSGPHPERAKFEDTPEPTYVPAPPEIADKLRGFVKAKAVKP